jgi:hypothetical protein
VLRTQNTSWAAALALVALAGCGYFRSGTWEDDPQNFERAFGSPKPAGAEVVHSRFTRYPHFTYEVTFYFQLQLTDDLLDTFLAHGFRRMEGAAALEAKTMVFSDAPAWFAPEPPARYDAWALDDVAPAGIVLRDRVTRDVFVFMSQL